jgi:hypothetical protein
LRWRDFIATDFSIRVDTLDLPLYSFTGNTRRTTHMAGNFFRRDQRPAEGCYTFQNSARSPLFEKPQRARHILLQDLRRKPPCRPVAGGVTHDTIEEPDD